MIRFIFVAGAIYGLLSVALGAFGAHALKNTLTEELLKTWDTGSRYLAMHAAVLLIVGVWARVETQAGASLDPTMRWAALCFFLGTLIFSGSLFALCLTGVRALGAITPIGGLTLMAGWVLLAMSAAKTL